MSALNRKEIDINRKVLADLAANDPAAFAEIVKAAQA
jgi:large subunit ribosomal protein L20